MIIGYLNLLGPHDASVYGALSQLAQDAGNELRILRAADFTEQALGAASTQFRALLDEADAFFMPDDGLLYAEAYAQLLHDRIRSGARLLVRLDENSLARQNAFLAHYDLTGTRLRIRSRTTPLIRLDRSTDNFRDARLFAGVDDVQVQHPNAIWYGGESFPVLVADDRYLAIDGATDFPTDWNLRELACVATWSGTNGGGVLAMSGGYLHDPYVSATGIEWPGIAVNQQFAKNLLRYLAEGRPNDTPEDRCKRIEINLADFVFGTLRATNQDWWNTSVPERIRLKCAERRAQEGRRFPVEAYCDLIDFKPIIEANWPLFEPSFRVAMKELVANASLDWIVRLNEVRRIIGHPLKKHVSGYEFSKADKALLRLADEAARRLRAAFLATSI